MNLLKSSYLKGGEVLELGVAGTMRTVEFIGTKYSDIDTALNEWLYANPDKEIIQIQYNSNSLLVIYRTERG